MTPLTPAEARAIRNLHTLASRWPDTLMLFSAAGTLVVVRPDWGGYTPDRRMTDDDVLARIDIPNDGGDPW